MSEYQCYEFLALDRPLTAKQRAELRSILSRAEITATRFTNEYRWGDLKGDPLQMVKEYFDAFLYLANWGTRQVMFRLPRGVLDPEIARPYCYTDTASLIETDGHLILSLNVDQEEADDYWDEPGGQLAVMVQARSELAAGDLRLLYLAWLLALQSDFVDDEETEPSVPPGLKNLSAGLRAVVDFFEIDENLIAVAAASSPAIEEPGGLAEWIASLAAEEKDSLLALVAGGEGAQVQALLLRRFRAARSGREVRLSSGNGSVSCVRSTTASRACRNGLIRRACRADELAAGQWRSPRVRSARVTVTAKGRSAANDPEVAAARVQRPSRSSKAVSSGWGGSGSTIQYDGTPNLSYAAFFLFRSMRAVLGERISTTSSGGSVNLAPPIWSMRTTTRSGSNSVCGPSSTAGSGTTHRSSGQTLLSTPYSRPATTW